VAVDDSRVYWSTDVESPTLDDAAVVRSCAKADCAATVITYATKQWGTRPIAVRSGRIYWPISASDGRTQSIVACPVGGCLGPPAVIAAGITVGELLVDDRAVYWASFPDSAVLSCPIDGCQGAPTVVALVDDPVPQITADQNNLYWSEGLTTGSGVIKTVPKDGSTPVRTIATDLHMPGAVAVDADRVYWAERYSPGTIGSCPIAGCGGEPTTLATGQPYPQALAIDRAHAYWLTTAGPYSGAGRILECPLSGCGSSPTVLAADQPTPTDLAIDASFVFWTNEGEQKQTPRAVYSDGSVNLVPIAEP
jgi:hypothetical protein